MSAAVLVQTLGWAPILNASTEVILDPEVRAQQATGAHYRVLVELRVAAGSEADRRTAITAGQDAVLVRLQRHAVVVRRYVTVPWLALEVDGDGLRALEGMGDVVNRVRPDTTAKTQSPPDPAR